MSARLSSGKSTVVMRAGFARALRLLSTVSIYRADVSLSCVREVATQRQCVVPDDGRRVKPLGTIGLALLISISSSRYATASATSM